MSLMYDGSGRRYTDGERSLAEDLARRVASALANATLYRDAQAAIRAREQFLSIAAHELRTPVAGVKLTTQMLLRDHGRGHLTPERLTRSLGHMEAGTDRLSRLTRDLLNVARLQVGQLTLRPVPLDPVGLVRDVVRRYQEQRPDRARVKLKLPRRAGLIQADADRLDQVITNLLENALKYSASADPVSVTLRGDASRQQVLLQIADRGIGLAAGTQDEIWDPFSRASNAAALDAAGMGLGLYISRDIVERHGGRIWAESGGEGKGSIFSITLPYYRPDSASGSAA